MKIRFSRAIWLVCICLLFAKKALAQPCTTIAPLKVARAQLAHASSLIRCQDDSLYLFTKAGYKHLVLTEGAKQMLAQDVAKIRISTDSLDKLHAKRQALDSLRIEKLTGSIDTLLARNQQLINTGTRSTAITDKASKRGKQFRNGFYATSGLAALFLFIAILN